MIRILASLLIGAAALSGCGLQPVYAPTSAAAAKGPITVEEIPGRNGYMLRRALQRELAIGLPGQTEPAVLSVRLQDDLTRLIFTPDGAASRASIVATANYVLASDQKTTTGNVNTEANFSVPDAPYGDISAQTAANDRAMRMLAQRIVDDLRLKLAER